jgi:hypothetical protein
MHIKNFSKISTNIRKYINIYMYIYDTFSRMTLEAASISGIVNNKSMHINTLMRSSTLPLLTLFNILSHGPNHVLMCTT